MRKKKPGLIFPSELRELYFPELPEDQLPTREALKEKILELHEGKNEEAAALLLPWNEKLKEQAESKFLKTSRITIFILVVLTGILGTLWLMFGNSGSSSSSLVVCSINGQIHEGDICFEKPEEKKEDEDKELVVPDSGGEILEGDFN